MAHNPLLTKEYLPLPLRVDSLTTLQLAQLSSTQLAIDIERPQNRVLVFLREFCGNSLATSTEAYSKIEQMVGGRISVSEELDRRKEQKRAALAPQQSMNRARIELRSLVKRALSELAYNTPPRTTTSKAEFAN